MRSTAINFLIVILVDFLLPLIVQCTDINDIHGDNRLIKNCLIHSTDRLRCLRCIDNYIFTEVNGYGDGTCELNSNQIYHNCLQRTRYGECKLCECGYSLLIETNRCEVTPPNDRLHGCQVIRNRQNPICIRPKPSFEIIQSGEGSDSFIQVQFSESSNCEIRFNPSGGCERCHAGFDINPLTNECIPIKHSIENVFYSFYKEGQLISRDLRFLAYPSGVYEILNDCIKHQFNQIKKRLECILCDRGRITNWSRTICVRTPFESCEFVRDDNLAVCYSCLIPQLYYVENGITCKRRQIVRNHKPCKSYDGRTEDCLSCNTPYILVNNQCVLQGHVADTITKHLTLPKLAHCQHQISQYRCLECKIGYFLNSMGGCMKQEQIIIGCTMLNAHGECVSCARGTILNENKKCMLNAGAINCALEEMTIFYQSCSQCQGNNYLNDKGICDEGISKCQMTNGFSVNCLQCENLFYLKQEEKGEQKQYQECKSIMAMENCLQSDGIRNKCLICRHLFELNGEGICESRIPYDSDGICMMANTLLRPNQVYCTSYDFQGNIYCKQYHQTENKCLKCIERFYIDDDGNCKQIPNCYVSNGIDKRCLYASNHYQYIDEDGWRVKEIGSDCQTNFRDRLCISCLVENEPGLVSRDDGSCVARSRIEENMSNNCISVSEIVQNGEPRFVCVLCSNLYFIDEAKGSVCSEISDEECEISDGIHNRCIVCGKQVIGFFENRNEIDEESGLCLKEPSIGQAILFCAEVKRGKCMRCNNLYYVWNMFTFSMCLPIHTPNCLLSDGILNNCQKCKHSYMKGHQFDICVPAFCEEINSKTNECTSCAPGFHFEPIEKKGQMCVIDQSNECIIHNETGCCKECRDGFYPNPSVISVNYCLRIQKAHCLKVDLNIEKLCIQCSKGYFLSALNECLPVNDRCIEYNLTNCIKCHSQYYLSVNHTCETIENCAEIMNNRCNRCLSGYFLSDEGERCQQVQFCLHSNGFHNFCLICKAGYVFNNHVCLHSNYIEHCRTYHHHHHEKCTKCASLFYLQPAEEGNDQVKCAQLSTKNCLLSDGIEDKCEICENDGYAFTEDSECIQISNCEFSDGIKDCIQCAHGYYLSTDSIENSKQALCIEQTEILNCVEYSLTKPACSRCNNFYYLSIDSLYCIEMSAIHTNHCQYSDGIVDHCDQCFDGYSMIQDFPATISSHCMLTRQRNVGCKFYSQAQKVCALCYDGYQFAQSTTNKSFCQLKVKQNIDYCIEYSPDIDECKACKNGYILSNQRRSCNQLQDSQKVMNCQHYEKNSNVCQECEKTYNENVVQYWLDRVQNKCVYALHLMCRSMEVNSMNCLRRYINMCLIYEEEWPQNCLECLNGFYVRDGLCFEHYNIDFCEKYHNTKQDTCMKCQLHYKVADDMKSCIDQYVEHCVEYDSNYECSRCDSEKYSVDSISGQCVEFNLEHCLKAQRIKPNEIACIVCSPQFTWNFEVKQCKKIPYQDRNCLQFIADSYCIQCAPNYILDSKQKCLPILSSPCIKQNCIEYSSASTADAFVCSNCSAGFAFSSQTSECVLQLKDISDNQEESETQEDSSQSQSGITIIIICIVLVIMIMVVVAIVKFCRKYTRFETTAETELIDASLNNLKANESQSGISQL